MKLIYILIVIFSFCSNVFGQIDTTQISKEVNSLKSISDHKKFWEQVYADDQEFRGKLSNDSINSLNLIKCCFYLNKFGYPKRATLGKESQIISYVWIHNKYPQTDLITFPIILEGFRAKEINEEDFRGYYFRAIYMNSYPDENYKDEEISELFKKLKPRISRPINISEVINTIKEEQLFLEQSHTELGIWYNHPKFDTLYHNNKPVVNEITSSPIRIFFDTEDNYFYQRLHDDDSHYPQKLINIDNKNNAFKLFEQSAFLMQIEKDGSLKLVNKDGSFERYITEKNQ